MSLAKRLTLFHEAALAKDLIEAESPSFESYYRRLFISRRVAEFILSAMVIFGGFQFILINHFFSPVWPAGGVALSALFLRGNATLLGIFAGTLLSYLYGNYPLLLGIEQSIAFTLSMYLIRACSLKWIGPVKPLFNRITLWLFTCICLILCAFHISIMGFLFIKTYHSVMSFYGWSVAILGELNGILCLIPLSLVFDPFVPQRYFTKNSVKWMTGALLIVLGHLLYFFIPSSFASALAAFFLILLCVYSAYFGLVPLCMTLFGISIIYLAGALPDAHLFQQNSQNTDTLSVLLIFFFSIMLSLSIGIYKQQRYMCNCINIKRVYTSALVKKTSEKPRNN